ncbi:MAG: lipopolysaccharide biosynthesis protein [Treponema sp.]|jgi:uncharacterized protein involved in exopolysaccharide biosynthesis|nr:lipopolysaccharide biosynthesis protein [Treponema sp.]
MSDNELPDGSATPADDEISLIDLFAVLLKYKKMIIGITVTAAVGILFFSILSLKLPADKSPLPNKYTPSVSMLINDTTSSQSGLSSVLSSSGLGSLASMAGVNVGGSSYSSLAVYLAGSNSFLDSVVDKFDLIKKWKIERSPRATSRKILEKKIAADYDEDSGVFTLSFTDIDPDFAQKVVNFSVDYMENMFNKLGLDQNKIKKENLEKNIEATYKEILKLQKQTQDLASSVAGGHSAWSIPTITTETTKIEMELAAQKQVFTSLKTQYELLKVEMSSQTPIFQILERPEIPDMKSQPSRGKLCIIVTFAAFFIAVFLAFLRNAWNTVKKDPEAMAKLKTKK